MGHNSTLLSPQYLDIQFVLFTRMKVVWEKAESMWQVHPTPRLYSPGGSIGLTVWLQFAVACFGWGFGPQFSPSPGGQRPHLTECVIGPNKCTCQMVSKSVERFKQGARMWQTTDRRYGEMRSNRRNRINCVTRTIPPKKSKLTHTWCWW